MIYSILCEKRGILEVKDGAVDPADHQANACGARLDPLISPLPIAGLRRGT